MVKFTIEEVHNAMQKQNNIRNISIVAHVDCGKCMVKGTLIPLYNGTVKPVEKLKIGDKLLGDENNAATIVDLYSGHGMIYEIKQNCGNPYYVNENHILCLKGTNMDGIYWVEKKGHYKVRWLEKFALKEKCISVKKKFTKKGCIYYETKEDAFVAAEALLQDMRDNNPNYVKYGDDVEIRVKDFIKLPKNLQSCFKGYKVAFEHPKKEVKLDPYMVGYWLGDGSKFGAQFVSVDKEVIDYFRINLEKKGLKLRQGKNTKKHRGEIKYSITTGTYDPDNGTWSKNNNSENYFTQMLRHYNLINNKHIPIDYKTNCNQVKLELLAGFIDSDGYYDKNRNIYEITQKRENLIDDLEYICRSLGLITNIRKNFTKYCTYKGEKKSGTYHGISISGEVLKNIPCKVERKKFIAKDDVTYKTLMTGISIKEYGEDDFYGFMLDGKQRHLLCDFTVTHNTTCTDSLLNKAGIISDDATGEKRGTDTRKDEQERIITIKSTGISLYYEMPEDRLPKDAEDKGFLINLIDSPGHVDFSSEVTAALRVTDGCMVIIDAVKGVCVQTETVLKQALDEMIVPVCMINKLDRLILELKLGPEEIYRKLNGHLVALNTVIRRYNKKMPEINLTPENGTVAIGCGKMGWGFNLNTFARTWAQKLKTTEEELIKKLWGENYYSVKKNEWYTTKQKGSVRGFNFFVMKPILDIIEAVMSDNKEKINKIVSTLKIVLNEKDKEKTGKDLMKSIMQKFLPNSDALLEMIILHLPSPIKAQQYRVDHLYTGPKDDAVYQAIKNCDPNGPLVMYISKMFPTPDLSRFFAFGRVFSGRIKADNVNVQGPAYEVGNDKDLYKNRRVQQVACWMASEAKALPDCPAGNTCALGGIDKFILKTATLTDSLETHNIKDMTFTVAPVVSVAVQCKKPSELPKLMAGLKLLAKSDPLCKVTMDKDTGETIIAGAGELHLEICINDLRDMFTKNLDIIVSDPVVPFRETVINESSQVCLSKSPNKHNRLYFTCEPIHEDLLKKMMNREINERMDVKERAKILSKEFGWNPDEARKIWAFSQAENTNVIVDSTKAVQYLNEIKDSVRGAFEFGVGGGPLCDEPVWGIKWNIKDISLHADAIHRGGSQIIPTTRRVMFASMLTASPRLMEPIYLVDIQCPSDISGNIYGIMAQKRGTIISEEVDHETSTSNIKAYLPVAESIGFTAFIRSHTGGKAFPQCTFSHWDVINDDPLVPGTKSFEIVKEIRKRKNLKENVEDLSHYLDKL